jgi:hypothetical protein
MDFTPRESKVVAGILQAVVGFGLAGFLFGVANRFGDEERHDRIDRARLLAHIAVDSRADLGDLDTFTGLDRPSAVPQSAAGTVVAAEQTLLSDLDSEIDQSEENERWTMGGAGAAGLLGLNGVFELVRTAGRRKPKPTGLERWWSDAESP